MNKEQPPRIPVADRFVRCIQTWTLWELLKGLRLTLGYLFAKKVTLSFPEEMTPRSRLMRGALALRRYPPREGEQVGEERCIACKLCEVNCPANAITIEVGERRSDGSRRTTRYDIDAFKCINCGFCEEACPTDAIVLTPEIHYHMTQRGENILDKQQLLAMGDKYEAVIARDRWEGEQERAATVRSVEGGGSTDEETV